MRRREFVGLLAAGLFGGLSRIAMGAPPPVGKLAPEFSLSLMDGRLVSLKDFRGKPVLVNFWASG